MPKRSFTRCSDVDGQVLVDYSVTSACVNAVTYVWRLHYRFMIIGCWSG